MAQSNSIESFPEFIDRNYFGAWLSGFVDGEGCFYIGFYINKKHSKQRPTPTTRFIIGIRADDLPAIRLIQSYFQCGSIYYANKNHIRKPTVNYVIAAANDLCKHVIPHFDKYPLLAKKSRDFTIFREAVSLACAVQLRKRGGRNLRWEECEVESFRSLIQKMKDGRTYQEDTHSALPLGFS